MNPTARYIYLSRSNNKLGRYLSRFITYLFALCFCVVTYWPFLQDYRNSDFVGKVIDYYKMSDLPCHKEDKPVNCPACVIQSVFGTSFVIPNLYSSYDVNSSIDHNFFVYISRLSNFHIKIDVFRIRPPPRIV